MKYYNYKGIGSSFSRPQSKIDEVYWAAVQIREKVRMVVADEKQFGVLSTGERIAVALVLDRHDLLLRAWGTIAEAIHRLGLDWTRAALYVQRMGWQDEEEDELQDEKDDGEGDDITHA